MNRLASEESRENIKDTSARLLREVQALAAEIRPQQAAPQPVTIDSALVRDLGLDSLARVELLTRIEKRFSVTLPERVFAEAETPRDLLRAVLNAASPEQSFEDLDAGKLSLEKAEAAPHSTHTLVEVLQWHVQAHPDRPHICLCSDEQDDEILTYRQLRDGARALAAGLQQRGLQAGEAVAIMLPTGRDYFFSFFGILMAGGIPVPIYPPVRPTQIEEHLRRHSGILSNCLAVMLITVPEAKRVAQLLKLQVPSLHSTVTAEELSLETGELVMPMTGAQDTVFLQYTSGSTGNPKGVVLTHANLLANIRVMGAAVQADSSDVFVSWLPLYHDMGLIGAWLGSLYFAALFVVMSPLAFLARPQRWLWAIHRYGGTLSAGIERIGIAGIGTFTQSGGTHTVTTNLNLGTLSTGSGVYTLSGGTLDVGGDIVNGAGTGRLNIDGGTLNVGLRAVELTEPASAPHSQTVPPGRYVVLMVSDTGEGMDEDTLSRAFEPFFTTRPVGEGSGLGLSTVYGIIEMNGGFIQTRSAPGVGTDIEIFLPQDESKEG